MLKTDVRRRPFDVYIHPTALLEAIGLLQPGVGWRGGWIGGERGVRQGEQNRDPADAMREVPWHEVLGGVFVPTHSTPCCGTGWSMSTTARFRRASPHGMRLES